nr:hypothetical protein [Candidatus Sigynarchaeota archaeon]
MDIRKQYELKAKEIIGDRSKTEEEYDNEVLDGLKSGCNIRNAIARANAKYPAEALAVDASNEQDVASHYEFLLEHEKIMKMARR